MNIQCLKHGHLWQRTSGTTPDTSYTFCAREGCSIVRPASQGSAQPLRCNEPANVAKSSQDNV